MVASCIPRDSRGRLSGMSGRKRRTDGPPRLVHGRKGAPSIVDALLSILWNPHPKDTNDWPVLSIADLRSKVSKILQYEVASSTVRSGLYSRPDVFKRCKSEDGRSCYGLHENVRLKLR